MNKNFLIRGGWIFALTKIFVVLFIVGSVIHYFILTIFIVDGPSMNPSLKNGEFVLVSRLSYRIAPPNRGEIIIMRFPGDPERKIYVKRIIGLPGEKIAVNDRRVYVNDKLLNEKYISDQTITEPDMEYRIEKNEYYVMGDNRPNSNDSRTWGALPEKDIIGKASLVFWPILQFRVIAPAVFLLK